MSVSAHMHSYLNMTTPFTTVNFAEKKLYRMCSTLCVTVRGPSLFQVIQLFSYLTIIRPTELQYICKM